MSDIYLLRLEKTVRAGTIAARERHAALSRGGRIIDRLPHGTLVELKPADAERLEAKGFRVVRYQGADRLRIAGRAIDITRPTDGLRPEEIVPAPLAQDWPLHVVQLRGPAFPEWCATIRTSGVEIVGRAGRFGLTVYGRPSAIDTLDGLPFVSMVSPLQPAWKLDPRLADAEAGRGRVSVTVFPIDAETEVIAQVKALGGELLHREPDRKSGAGRLTLAIDPRHALTLGALPAVLYVGWLPVAQTFGEREAQIVAENLDGVAAPNQGPVVGYQDFLADLDADGSGVTVAIADSGIDAGVDNNTAGHLDLRGRQVDYTRYILNIGGGVTNTPPPTDTSGHGTHVAGIAVGNAASGTTEGAAPNDFLWGQGVAPGADYYGQAMQSATDPGDLWVPPIAQLCRDAVTNGASVQNNSWGSGAPTTYTPLSAAFDTAVRDADGSTDATESLAVVFSAGNAGGLPGTVGTPGEAKNVITVGNCLTRRPNAGFPDDDIRGINGSSSRGPATGGRRKPDVVAPGTNVSAARSATSAYAPIPGSPTHTSLSGTSMAAPAVAGACAVLIDWWRARTGGASPSPAMLKALLVNGAEDLAGGSNWRNIGLPQQSAANALFAGPLAFTATRVVASWWDAGGVRRGAELNNVGSTVNMPDRTWTLAGGTLTCRVVGAEPNQFVANCLDQTPLPNVPNIHQGWGRVSLRNIVRQAPASDRGQRLFLDQRTAFTASGQRHDWRIQAVDETRPLRITLAYTDAPGEANSDEPLANDLNLMLQQTAGNTTTTWRGNSNFQDGFSMPGGAFDSVNNVECIYLESPSGVYDLSVLAQTLVANARDAAAVDVWQDYALVVENAVFASADPVAISLVLDRSGSMQTSGYVDVTRTASKQFVDLMSADDALGVVSFGDSAKHEYHANDAVVTITGDSEKVAAKAAIDAIQFTGCTYMGQGLELAEQQLANTSSARAVVMLSDGKDNKGCRPNDAGRRWAKDVAADLPNDIEVYTCAMGPLSDQSTLEEIASLTGGRYYYMPAIDDLYEIYNFIRGNVTSTGVIVNTTSTASRSRVAARVDCSAESVMLACQWHTPSLRWTGGEPNPKQIRVRLRTPDGRLLDPDTAWVHRQVGEGYVVFTIQDPQPGRWQVEVETSRRQHTRYTVGGWVRSDVQLRWTFSESGDRSLSAALGLDGGKGLRASYRATLIAPPVSTKDLLRRHWGTIGRIRPDRALLDAGVAPDLAKLYTFDTREIANGKASIFAPKKRGVRVTRLPRALERDVVDVRLPIGRLDGVGVRPPRGLEPRLDPSVLRRLGLFKPPVKGRMTHGIKVPVRVDGSYTLRMTARMVNRRTGCRFERIAAESVYVGDRD